MGAALLRVEGVEKSYGRHAALRGVSLAVQAGEICGLLGPNGAGKTTLVSIVAGLREPDRGRVLLDGVDAASGDAAKDLVGLAAQETAIYPTVTVRENLVLFAELAGLRRRERDARIDEIAAMLELDALMDRQGRNLSGGEKRRLHTAMALVHRPRIVLLDEPTTGVDVTTRQRLLDSVRRFAGEDGTAVVYSTHYLPEIEQLDASVVVLDQGKVLAQGSVSGLVARSGRGAVEITLSGQAPVIEGAEVEPVEGGTLLRFRGDNPGALLARAMARLGTHAERVVDVEVLRPSLESVYLDLTGLRASRLGTAELLSGKAITPILSLMLQLVVMFGAGALLFDLHVEGPVVGVVAVAAALVLMEVALGFMLLSLCRSVLQLNAATNIGAMVLGGIGGAVTPIDTLPGWAQAIAPFTPAYWAMQGFTDVIIGGEGASGVVTPLAVLGAFTVGFLVIAALRFRVEDSKVSWA